MMGNDIITATISANPVVSKITLAFFQDTGWYEVDYDQAETFFWGYQDGCPFLNTSCYDSQGHTPFPEYFCEPQTHETFYGCTEDYTSKGIC